MAAFSDLVITGPLPSRQGPGNAGSCFAKKLWVGSHSKAMCAKRQAGVWPKQGLALPPCPAPTPPSLVPPPPSLGPSLVPPPLCGHLWLLPVGSFHLAGWVAAASRDAHHPRRRPRLLLFPTGTWTPPVNHARGTQAGGGGGSKRKLGGGHQKEGRQRWARHGDRCPLRGEWARRARTSSVAIQTI